jgi:phosphoglucosamine mutase
LSKLVDSIPSYPVIRGSIASNGAKIAVLKRKLIAELNPLSSDTLDGIKLNFKDGWLLIRPSGTEPKIRLTAEAESESVARQHFEDGSRIIRECNQV